MGRRIGVLVVIAALGVAATGCGGGDGETGAESAAFDRAFIDGMVPHHGAALAMANEAKDAGLSDPELVEIANAILSTQQAEIDQMREWREEWYGSSEIDPDGAAALGLTMDEMGMSHESGSLEGATDVDAAFAAAMIAHHEGAVAMARLALERAERGEVRTLAQAIVDAQTSEIERMRPHAAGEHAGHG